MKVTPIYRGFNIPPQSSEIMSTDLQALRNWGANIVRWQMVADMATVTKWDLATYNAWLEKQLDLIDQLLPLCEKIGVNVIVDMHTPVGGGTPTDWGCKYTIFSEQWAADAFVAQWKEIANRFSGHTAILGYDLLNEPGIRHAKKWIPLAQQVANEIRAVDKDKIIIVESVGSDPRDIYRLKPLTSVDPVWYSVHMYLPSAITFQGIPDSDCNMIPIGDPYPSSTITKQNLIDYLENARTFQQTYNVPIFVGEYSCARWSGYPNYQNAYNYLKDCIDIFDSYGWNWCYHAFREASCWNLEYSTKPCPDRCKPSCTEPLQVTDRVKLMQQAFSDNT